ncbi:MAG: DNA repair protein RecN [Crocinitomicaceae bacterium]|nr:DNA repair protein RecN [Crocinitomicaceae bacterium]MDG2463880.1 DNA repair protein RecN [Crocinitomicaceae bacterium]
MLAKIWIKNFALIQELRVDFSKGYTVITGETGSGKSILLGALNLILGERADFSLIGPEADKTLVEAEFVIKNLDLSKWFKENDVDYEGNTIVRREINRNGRSRAFINDTPVSLVQIKQLTENLVNINSQHNTLALRDKNFHLNLLDILSGLEPEIEKYTDQFNRLKENQKRLKSLIEKTNQADSDRDYLLFQLEEIDLLNLDRTDYASLENELNQQENMEELTTALSSIAGGLSDDGSVLEQIKSIQTQLNKAKSTDSKVGDFATRIQSILLELEDLENESSNYLEKLEKDPQKVLELTAKLDNYNRISQKHKCSNQKELVDLKASWQEQLQTSTEGRAEIERLTLEVNAQEKAVIALADALHNTRKKTAPQIEKKITSLLDELKMPNTELKFEVVQTEQLNQSGNSTVGMKFSSNAGIPLQAMDKIASGGELSRLMLSIQCLISEMKALPSIIFDEIDTGVSGEVAQKIGQLLRRMGENRQLVAISHLPQVAGKATAHIKVEKSEVNGRVQSRLLILNQEERVEEIARLMSGEKINVAALTNAQNLMQE